MIKRLCIFKPVYRGYQYKQVFILITLILGAAVCGASSPYYKYAEDQPDCPELDLPADGNRFTLFLIGDTGDPSTNPPEPNLKILQYQLKEAGEQSAVVFLGDNIYTMDCSRKIIPNVTVLSFENS